jgi:DNA-directed RNA polymerase subunit RPC12/RpoP
VGGTMTMFNEHEPIMLEEYTTDPTKQWTEILKEDTIKCTNCKHELLDVLKVKEDKEINTALRVICPYCTDTSFWYKISGKIYVQAADGLSIDNNPVVKQNGILFTTITMIKEGA